VAEIELAAFADAGWLCTSPKEDRGAKTIGGRWLVAGDASIAPEPSRPNAPKSAIAARPARSSLKRAARRGTVIMPTFSARPLQRLALDLKGISFRNVLSLELSLGWAKS
jgi:hypothetical protein